MRGNFSLYFSIYIYIFQYFFQSTKSYNKNSIQCDAVLYFIRIIFIEKKPTDRAISEIDWKIANFLQSGSFLRGYPNPVGSLNTILQSDIMGKSIPSKFISLMPKIRGLYVREQLCTFPRTYNTHWVIEVCHVISEEKTF